MGAQILPKWRHSACHHKIHYLEHEWHGNCGMSTSRNVGLHHAKGEYVLFMDGDDVLTHQVLQEQVALMDMHPEVGMVYGPLYHWFEWNESPYELGRDFIQNLDLAPNTAIEGRSVLTTFLRNSSATPCGNLFRTALVRAVGGLKTSLGVCMRIRSYDLNSVSSFPSNVSSQIWYKYRQHADSCCAEAVRKNDYDEARKRFLYWTEDYCREHDVHDPRIWSAIQKALRPYRYPRIVRLEKQMVRWKTRVIHWAIATASPVARRALSKATREGIWNYLKGMKSLQDPHGRLRPMSRPMQDGTQDSLAVRATQVSKKYTITVGTGGSPSISERLDETFKESGELLARRDRRRFGHYRTPHSKLKAERSWGLIGRNGAGKKHPFEKFCLGSQSQQAGESKYTDGSGHCSKSAPVSTLNSRGGITCI